MAVATTCKSSIAPQPISPHQAIIVDMINGASATMRIYLPSCADVAAVRGSRRLMGLGLLIRVRAVELAMISRHSPGGQHQGLIKVKAVSANVHVTNDRSPRMRVPVTAAARSSVTAQPKA